MKISRWYAVPCSVVCEGATLESNTVYVRADGPGLAELKAVDDAARDLGAPHKG